MTRSLAALALSCVAGVLLLSYHWQRLPDRVASHFDAAGRADGWMSRDTHFFLAAGLILGLTAAFYLIGSLVSRLPPRWINLPNKDYWFAEEREHQTRHSLSCWAFGFGAFLNVFLLFVFHLVYIANLSDPISMDNRAMIAALLVFIGGSLGSVIKLLNRFGRGR